MRLTLRLDSLSVVILQIDDSYNTRDDCKGRNVIILIIGRDDVLSFPLKQKLNVISSTERELLCAHYGLSVVLWRKHFIEYQIYLVDNNKLYQNNQSTTIVENNGRAPSFKINKYIKFQ